MTKREINPTSRRFARQAIRHVTQGRQFGDARRNPRSVQASTTSAVAVSLGTTFTQHDITTDASGLARTVNVGVVGPFFVGQRKLIRLVTKAGGTDTFTMDAASLIQSKGAPVTSLTFNTAGQTAYIEWNGAKWMILNTTAVLT